VYDVCYCGFAEVVNILLEKLALSDVCFALHWNKMLLVVTEKPLADNGYQAAANFDARGFLLCLPDSL